MRFFYLIIFVLVTSLASASVTKNAARKKQAVLKADTAGAVDIRRFDTNSLKNYTKQADFRYSESKDMSWWESFWQWLWDWITGIFKFKKVPGSLFLTIISILWRILELIVIFGGIAALIYFMLKAGG
ncbi:MAG TPA: hypothetical protein VHS53_10380, partial [Mucilaginibacter sp.]|nr:hypothetical protein [Mucilaginibacter sp.]